MYQIKLENCNSISQGIITIEEGKLNIKYGINGTGKTTIAKAIEMSSDVEKLQELKSFGSDSPAKVDIVPSINNTLVFNERFVEQFVFKEDEVIEQSFEIFLKTPNYDEKKEKLDTHLQTLKMMLFQQKEIIELREILLKINSRFKRTGAGKINKAGTYKSLLSKQNLYSVPEELLVYKPFIENGETNISWIDWKNKGEEFDVENNCPYCAEELVDKENHEKRKDIFKKTYKKADSQNLKEILELLANIKDYIVQQKYSELVSCIKLDTPEDVIEAIIQKMLTEIELISNRFQAIEEFGKRKIAIADIGTLEEQVAAMEFPKSVFDIFGGEKIENIFNSINEKVHVLKSEITALKSELGELKGIMQATILKSQNDINEFLSTAGINYELVILAEDEMNSKTILRQCFSEEKTDVTKIRQHLSWGEKNAFSLILFMYYANMKKPELIVLDDPISSFDSNKKYAILHRMFKNIGRKDVSFVGKTVLLLTHDFEPITDFLVVGKLDKEHANSFFISNEDGVILEKKIEPDEDVKLIMQECDSIAKNEEINLISRIAFLRKLCELNGCKSEWGFAYEILSCLIHAAEIKRKIAENVYIDMDPREVSSGMALIRTYISDFDYSACKGENYTVDGIKALYNGETNPYFKVQLFRALKDIVPPNVMRLSPLDEAWYKFIDETYHIENDYLHYLDIMKFNIVPGYIMKRVEQIMKKI